MIITFKFAYKMPKRLLNNLRKLKKNNSIVPLGLCNTLNKKKSYVYVNLIDSYDQFEKKIISDICDTIQHEYLHAVIHQSSSSCKDSENIIELMIKNAK